MTKISIQRGFTIVELLTVIAIIGILAGVILTSLDDARQDGIDAKIRSEMDSIAKRASIENVQTLTYDTVCGSNSVATSTVIAGLIASINNFASSTVTCNSDTSGYAVSVPVGTTHWCIDDLGTRKEIPNALSAGQLACP